MVVYSPESQCAHKRRYKRRSHAVRAMRQQQTGGRVVTRLCVYRCPHCDWFHIGNDPTLR